MHRTLAAALALFVVVLAPAQQRRATIGTVRGADGEPLAAARVFYAGAGGAAEVKPDVVEATTDARGRFRVSLLPCARYRAWAIGPPNDAGAVMVSELVWTTFAELTELTASHRRSPKRIRLTGLEPWADDGPFRLQWLVDGAVAFEPQAVDAEGRTELPALPATNCAAELIDRRGDVFETFNYDPKRARDEVKIDPPHDVPIRAVDERDQPLADVEIMQRITSAWRQGHPFGPYGGSRYVWRRLGATDADGRITARIAGRNDPMKSKGWQQITLLGKKPGHAACFAGIRDKPFTNGKRFATENFEELPMVLQVAKPLRGRFLRLGQTDLELQLCCLARVRDKDRNGWINEKMIWRFAPDADGRFNIADLPHDFDRCELLLQPSAGAYDLLPEALRRRTPPVPLALHERRFDRDAELTIDLSATHVLDLQVLDEQSGPVQGALVMFLSREHDQPNCDWTTPQGSTDRAGRLAMRLERGKWLVFVRNATAMAHAAIEIDADGSRTLKLAPMPAMHGTVVDGDGNPIANADLNCHSATYHNAGQQDQQLHTLANALNWRWIDAVKTDSQGRFVCAYLDMPNMSYEARFRLGKRQSAEFRIIASEDPETIVIK